MIAMYDPLGFSPQASEILYTDQSIDELRELSILCNTEVESLYKLIRRLGGLIPNPNVAGTGQVHMINTHGHRISMRANLKLACYLIYHHIRTSRTCTAVTVVLVDVWKLRDLRDLEEAYLIPDSPPCINNKNWLKTLESIVLWVAKHLGLKKSPM